MELMLAVRYWYQVFRTLCEELSKKYGQRERATLIYIYIYILRVDAISSCDIILISMGKASLVYRYVQY